MQVVALSMVTLNSFFGDQFKPKSFYGYSKLLNENIAKEFYQKHNISSIGLRFFTVYGEYGVLIWLTFL